MERLNGNRSIIKFFMQSIDFFSFLYKSYMHIERYFALRLRSGISSRYKKPLKKGSFRIKSFILRQMAKSKPQVPSIMDYPSTQVPVGDPAITNLMYAFWQTRCDLPMHGDIATTENRRKYHKWYNEYICNFTNRIDRPVDNPLGEYVIPSIHGIPGVNVVGYLNLAKGMGELSRAMISALDAVQVPRNAVNMPDDVDMRQMSAFPPREANKHKINVFNINADQMLNVFCYFGRSFFHKRYNIGNWAWELSDFPDQWLSILPMIDEVWTFSTFVQKSIQQKTNKPVIYIPIAIDAPVLPKYTRVNFSLDDERFLFVFSFDGHSFIDRKNPFAVAAAFKKAFPDVDEKVGLVIKVQRAEANQEKWNILLNMIDGDPRISIINKTLTKEEVLGLYSVCDCFVSLHRSEGFGMGIAEAMALGLPVIATNYSGNTDFCLADNSCLVDYTMIPVGSGEYVFSQDQSWADPDIEQAAWYMRKLFSDKSYRCRLGNAGSRFIRDRFNNTVVGTMIKKRLNEIDGLT